MVNTERILENFKAMVALDSPSLDERLVCEYIKRYLADLGITCTEDNAGEAIHGTTGNLYAFVDGEVPAAPLVFSAHTDTVEPSHGKTAIVHEDGTITSDGTTVLGSDDLAGVVAILEAITQIKENNLPHRPLELLFTVCEESHCGGVSFFDFDSLKSKQAYVFDMDGDVGSAASSAPTILTYQVHFHGKAAHAGFDADNGIHAIKAAAKAVTLIPCGNIDRGVTANVGIISGGKATNVVPDLCTITGEIRSFDNSKVQEKLQQVLDICKACAEEIGATVESSHEIAVTAFNTPDDTEVVQRFKACCKELGMSGDTYPTFGGSDNNVLAAHGVEGIVVATAMNNCHSVTEFTSLKGLTDAAELALKLMLSKD
ncbi:MAG: M20/M25/M40 family metallo-hydrolase [Eubacterium sp.]|nr:M20/M25/M40 family metallo-hydrolase [Eubacterium sp.]